MSYKKRSNFVANEKLFKGRFLATLSRMEGLNRHGNHKCFLKANMSQINNHSRYLHYRTNDYIYYATLR